MSAKGNFSKVTLIPCCSCGNVGGCTDDCVGVAAYDAYTRAVQSLYRMTDKQLAAMGFEVWHEAYMRTIKGGGSVAEPTS